MRGEPLLREFLVTGRLGILRLGELYEVLLSFLGPTDMRIEDTYVLYRYADIEFFVNSHTGLIWSIQVDPFDGVARIPPGLGSASAIDLPVRDALIGRLDEWEIVYDVGEYHVPGQEELRIRKSGVTIAFFDDGSVASLIAEDLGLRK